MLQACSGQFNLHTCSGQAVPGAPSRPVLSGQAHCRSSCPEVLCHLTSCRQAAKGLVIVLFNADLSGPYLKTCWMMLLGRLRNSMAQDDDTLGCRSACTSWKVLGWMTSPLCLCTGQPCGNPGASECSTFFAC